MTGFYSAIRLGLDKNPAHGEVIASAEGDGGTVPPQIEALWRPGEVCISWSCNTPIKHLPEASLAKLRRTRLHNRLQRDFPLLADQLEQRELAARPSFFAGKRNETPNP